jgi:hypothetical protein
LRRVDINQCPRSAHGADDGGTLANIFMGTDKCKATTKVSKSREEKRQSPPTPAAAVVARDSRRGRIENGRET